MKKAKSSSKAKKPAKLRGVAKKLASEYIAEEMRAHKYPHKQAIAIGISRARAKATKTAKTAKKVRR